LSLLRLLTSTTIDLSTGIVSGGSQIAPFMLSGIENVNGSPGDDTITGDAGPNRLRGGGGADHLLGAGGDDVLDGEDGTDDADGGDGTDTCSAETVVSCEG
jgi:Ca2+-binding RTX toxin-like protein